jgi:predicted permease
MPLVRWLMARRVGREEADRFLEELEELHAARCASEGASAGDRWLKRELRLALLSSLGRRVRESAGGRRAGRPYPSFPSWTQDLSSDLRLGIRNFRKRPHFSFLVVGTLGLGIGATTTVFSLVDGVLLKNMAYDRPGELVTIHKTFPGFRDDPVLGEAWDKLGLRWNEFLALRDDTRKLREVAAHRAATLTLSGVGDPVRLDVGEASADLFRVLGIRPFLGRTFLPGEEGPNSPRLVVLSQELWKGRFGSDSTVLGRPINLDGEPFEVIGVLPPGVRVHSSFYNVANAAIDTGDRALWVPANWGRMDDPNGSMDLEPVARIQPGVTREEAAAETDALLRGEISPEMLQFRLSTLKEEVVRGHRMPLFLLLGASGLLLLIACANAATLLLGEAADRGREISTRVALGAGGGRIARQLFTESLILALASSLVGLVLTPMGIRAFLALGPSLPRLQDVAVNRSVLLASILSGVVCAVVFGFGPALLQHKRSPHALLQREGRWSTGGGSRLQGSLVTGQLALTLVLVISGGLFARSLGELGRVDAGFDPGRVATVRVQIPEGHFGSDREGRLEGTRRLRQEVLGRVRAIPGVLHAGAIDGLPFPGGLNGTSFQVQGASDDEPRTVLARNRLASRGYFGAMGIPLLAGRDFTDADGDEGGERVVIINETMAREFSAGGSPLDARITEGGDPYTIIGVVGDVRERHLAEEPRPTVYRHASLSTRDFSIVAGTTGGPENLVPLLRQAVRTADPGVALTQETTLEAVLRESSGAERFRTFLVAAFAGMAAVLALVGVFGVTARSVSRRSREMGIRMALGAGSGGLVRMMALATLRAGVLGIVLGIVGALVTTRLLTAFFFGIHPWDLWTFAGAVFLLGFLCVGAAILAAQRVTRVEPMRVLREE